MEEKVLIKALEPLQLAPAMSSYPTEHQRSYNLSQLYDKTVFVFYSPEWYRHNKELQENDELYGFDTTVFLHLATGLRLEYHIHESYVGEEYKLSRIFVVTNDNLSILVNDVDYAQRIVFTGNGVLPMAYLSRSTEGQ